MTPGDSHADRLRRALHAEAEQVVPAPDGLQRIRARTAAAPRPGLWSWMTGGWKGPLLAGAAAVTMVAVAVSATPSAIDRITSAGNPHETGQDPLPKSAPPSSQGPSGGAPLGPDVPPTEAVTPDCSSDGRSGPSEPRLDGSSPAASAPAAPGRATPSSPVPSPTSSPAAGSPSAGPAGPPGASASPCPPSDSSTSEPEPTAQPVPPGPQSRPTTAPPAPTGPATPAPPSATPTAGLPSSAPPTPGPA